MSRRIAAALSILVVALSACAAPPQHLVDQARKAMEDAKAAGAESYAYTEMKAATQAFNDGEAEVVEQNKKFAASRCYKKAMDKYNDAIDGFEKAAALSKMSGGSPRREPVDRNLEERVDRMEEWFRENVRNW